MAKKRSSKLSIIAIIAGVILLAALFIGIIRTSNTSFNAFVVGSGGSGSGGVSQCTDSDGGLNYNVKGIAQSGNVARADYCRNNSTLLEYYCSSNYISGKLYVCPQGCINGACNFTLNTPTGLTALSFVPGQVNLSWNNVSGAAAYKIYRSNNNGVNYSNVANSTGKAYLDSGLPLNKTYFYRVSAITGNVESGLSNVSFVSLQLVGNLINSCGTINAPGIYYLSNNITNVFVNGTNVSCIFIKANNVTLDGNGYTIRQVTTGKLFLIYGTTFDPTYYYGVILAYNVSNITVRNMNIISADGAAIRLDRTVASSIINNNLTTVTDGIFSYQSANLTVKNNNVVNASSIGIYIFGEFPTLNRNNLISNNYVFANNYQSSQGIYVSASMNASIINNTVLFSYSPSQGIGIYYNAYWDNGVLRPGIVRGNNITGFYHGILITSVGGDLIDNNLISHSGGNGIYLQFSNGGVSNTIISNNKISQSFYGIYAPPQTTNIPAHTKIINNTLSGNNWGMYFTVGGVPGTGESFTSVIGNNNISNNNITGSSISGILFYGDYSNNTLNSNYVCGNSADFTCTTNSGLSSTDYASGNRFTTRNGCTWADTGKISC